MLTRCFNSLYLAAIYNSPYRPKFGLIQRWGDYYISNLSFTDEHATAISQNLASGMDKNRSAAVAKSISEYVERLAFRLGSEAKNPLVQSYGTEGFAAYPKHRPGSLKLTRLKSLHESIEKYCWPYFWHHRIAFTKRHGDPSSLSKQCDGFAIEELIYLYPSINSPMKLCICLGKIGTEGVIVGGACDLDLASAEEHALSEMLRHYLATQNLHHGYHAAHCNYGLRLKALSQSGFSLWQERLKLGGKAAIDLPALKIDAKIDHPFAHFYHVYRTRFEKQMAFIDANTAVGYL